MLKFSEVNTQSHPGKGDDSVVLFGYDKGPMRQSLRVIPFLFFVGFLAQAQSPQSVFNNQFASSRIEFPGENSPYLDNPGRYPWLLNFAFSHLFNWSPTGEKKQFSAPCAAEVWQEHMKDSRSSPHLQGALVQKYFQECGREIETGDSGVLSSMVKTMAMNYEPQEHPFLRRIVFNLPGNVKLKGLLALKGDMKRRPLVVVRLGIFSSVEDFRPERAWLMMLFEQSPFNVLAVENISSADFIANNTQFSMGGYDEGIQNIHIARLLTSSVEPLSQIVDSVHMFGVSLGGHGVLFSSLLNKYNSPVGRPLINSFTALCPVVNLKETFDKLTHNGYRSMATDWWVQGRLAGLVQKMPAIADHKPFKFLPKTILELAQTYKGGLSYISSIRLPPGMKDGSDFWGLNNYWPFYSQVEQPVIIYASHNDPVVPFRENSGRIQNKSLKIDSRNITVIDFPLSVHCTLPIPYDWSTLSTLFSSYILLHSPNFKTVEKKFEIELSGAEWGTYSAPGVKIKLTVDKPKKNAGFAPITITAIDAQGAEKKMSLSLPLSQFDFRFFNSELSISEREMIVRWLNQNLKVRLVSVGGRLILKTSWMVAL